MREPKWNCVFLLALPTRRQPELPGFLESLPESHEQHPPKYGANLAILEPDIAHLGRLRFICPCI